jgi:Baseplate J-like protein
MSLPLPALDDRTYSDLVEEARALIPGLDPGWTNHNPSDPGITLIELFAWLTEMLIYRVDRLPRENVRTFLRLLNGPDWTPGADLDEDVRATLVDLRRRHRAVTAADYEALALEAAPGVARARCVPRRDLSALTEAERNTPRAGRVSLIVLPAAAPPEATDPASLPGAPLPAAALLQAVADDLEPRRLLTVRQSIVAPVYAPVQAEIVLARRPDVPESGLLARAQQAISGFLDARTGGPDGAGWPFGRDVYVSELYQLLETVPGIDHVPDVALSSLCPAGAPRCVAAVELRHDNGDPIGLGLGAHQLPWALIDPAKIVVAAAFVPLRLAVDVVPDAAVAPAAARAAVKDAVRALFHPLHAGPTGAEPWQIHPSAVRSTIEGLPEITAVLNLVIDAPPGRISPVDGFLRIAAGELADAAVTVALA